MIECPSCHQLSPDGSVHCIYCGWPDSVYTSAHTVQSSSYQQPAMSMQVGQVYSQQEQDYMQQENSMGACDRPDGTLFGEFAPRVGSMLLFFIAMCIPILNLIIFFKVGFGRGAPPIKQAYMRAMLIFFIIMLVVSITGSIAIGAAVASSFSRMF